MTIKVLHIVRIIHNNQTYNDLDDCHFLRRELSFFIHRLKKQKTEKGHCPHLTIYPQHASLLISLHIVPVGKLTQRVPRALFTLLLLPHTQFIMRGGSTGSSSSTLTVPDGESWQPHLSPQPYVPSHPAPSS